jgi:anti-sigma factor RsiW
MMTHEELRRKLTLAAAGVLDPSEQRTVDQHLPECDDCRRELEILSRYSTSLGSMPQPVVPEGLLERTRLRVAEAGWAAAERRSRDMLLALLVMFSWVAGAGLWMAAREITGGALSALIVTTLLTWTTAGAAVVLLGKYDVLGRRAR